MAGMTYRYEGFESGRIIALKSSGPCILVNPFGDKTSWGEWASMLERNSTAYVLALDLLGNHDAAARVHHLLRAGFVDLLHSRRDGTPIPWTADAIALGQLLIGLVRRAA